MCFCPAEALKTIVGAAMAGVSVLSLCEKGDAFITVETGKIFKKEKDMKKGRSFVLFHYALATQHDCQSCWITLLFTTWLIGERRSPTSRSHTGDVTRSKRTNKCMIRLGCVDQIFTLLAILQTLAIFPSPRGRSGLKSCSANSAWVTIVSLWLSTPSFTLLLSQVSLFLLVCQLTTVYAITLLWRVTLMSYWRMEILSKCKHPNFYLPCLLVKLRFIFYIRIILS